MLAVKDMGVEKEIKAYLLYLADEIKVVPVFLDRLF